MTTKITVSVSEGREVKVGERHSDGSENTCLVGSGEVKDFWTTTNGYVIIGPETLAGEQEVPEASPTGG